MAARTQWSVQRGVVAIGASPPVGVCPPLSPPGNDRITQRIPGWPVRASTGQYFLPRITGWGNFGGN
jgi:hypothetical protein